MPLEINIFIMYTVHTLGTEMGGQKSAKVLKSIPENTNQASII